MGGMPLGCSLVIFIDKIFLVTKIKTTSKRCSSRVEGGTWTLKK